MTSSLHHIEKHKKFHKISQVSAQKSFFNKRVCKEKSVLLNFKVNVQKMRNGLTQAKEKYRTAEMENQQMKIGKGIYYSSHCRS